MGFEPHDYGAEYRINRPKRIFQARTVLDRYPKPRGGHLGCVPGLVISTENGTDAPRATLDSDGAQRTARAHRGTALFNRIISSSSPEVFGY